MTGQPKRSDRRNQSLLEVGASSVILVLLIPVLFGALALALDFGKLVYERQHLNNALDAAALAGSYALPNDPTAAKNTAIQYAKKNDPQANPTVTFWCVVASSGTAKTPASGQVPGVCNPGGTAGAKCNETICAIPCTAVAGHLCNTITVSDKRDVPFSFAPVIGVKTGSTGALASTACRGGCGAQSPNPMDVALVADRTSSMSSTDRNLMVSGIKNTLQTMTQQQQFVALGTIHRSVASPKAGTCITAASSSATTGPWIPVPFSNNYTLPPAVPGSKPALNTGSTLVQGLNCLPESSGNGTYLASPMKAAARYVLGKDPNNLGSLLPARSTTIPAKKAIIFETDGQPNETTPKSNNGTTSLDDARDIGNSDSGTACNNLAAVATNAKQQGVLIVTVAFGDATTASCGTKKVRDVLAAAASPDAKGNASTANNCSSATEITAENSDGDFFFCAAKGDELGPIFVSAINAISPNTHLMRIPD
ncbi:pilus assembly protein TadG-related protein [Arthrobacter alpinus]|nr:pilus assembly protein TadG-related protein [Arthrobacter alpinus]